MFTEDAQVIEHPNSIKPKGGTADLVQLLQAARVGAQLLSRQRYHVHSAIEHGDLAIIRLTSTGTLASDAGSLRAGQQLRAHVAQFVRCRSGKIVSIETFDCYEPF